MYNRIKTQLFAFMTLLVCLLPLATPVQALSDLQGKAVNLDTLIGNGKWSVFEIWASDCHVCRKTIHSISDFEASYPQANVYGISIDGAEGRAQAQAFVADYGLSFPNLLAEPQEINSLLNAKAGESLLGTPTFMVFNPQGKLIAVQPGPVSAPELVAFITKQQAQ